MNKFIRFLKTTAIGGLLFLLPLIVIGALIGQIVPIIMSVARGLGGVIPIKTPGGIGLLILLSIAVLLLACFGAGLLARRSLGKKLSENFEKYLLLLVPRYAIIKEQMVSGIGGHENIPTMKPVLVRFIDSQRIGFETERTDDGLVTVYLPGSPDPWAGSVVQLNADRVKTLDAEFGNTVATFEQLGRKSAALLADNAIAPP
jgi:uncharacterized membrane protein